MLVSGDGYVVNQEPDATKDESPSECACLSLDNLVTDHEKVLQSSGGGNKNENENIGSPTCKEDDLDAQSHDHPCQDPCQDDVRRQIDTIEKQRAIASQKHTEALEKLAHHLEFLRGEHARVAKLAAVAHLALEWGTVRQEDELIVDLKKEMEDHATWAVRSHGKLRGQTPSAQKRLHVNHQLSLLDIEYSRKASLTTLRRLTEQIEDTESASTAINIQGGVQRVVNPHCTPSEHMVHQLEESQATEDDTGILGDVLYTRLDLDRSEESEETLLEPLFPVLESNRKYQATAADLTLQSSDGTRAEAKGSVIDSGAARCAIDYQHLKRWFPKVIIRPTGRSFHDASGNRMRIAGEVDLAFLLGDLKLWTTVYVFHGLGHHFLLGVNAIHQHGLTISSERSILFSERPEATTASSIPLTMANCNICDSTDTSTNIVPTAVNPCHCSRADVTCCLTEMCLKVQLHKHHDDFTQQPLSLACYNITPIDVRTQRPLSTEKQTEVRVHYRVKLSPGETTIVPLEYGQMCKGEETTAEVEVSQMFMDQFPDIRITPLSYHSTLTRHVNLRMKNVGQKTITLVSNELVAIATYHAKRPKARPLIGHLV